jgi:hypothetical protein
LCNQWHDLFADRLHLCVEGADVLEVLICQLQAHAVHRIGRAQFGQQLLGSAGAQSSVRSAGRELGEQPVEPAYRLRA